MARIYIPGPLHPDLFDGATPIMTPFDRRVFDVSVTVVERRDEHVLVLAADEQEAEDIAGGILDEELSGDEDCEEFSVREVEVHKVAPDRLREAASACEAFRASREPRTSPPLVDDHGNVTEAGHALLGRGQAAKYLDMPAHLRTQEGAG